MILSDNSDSSGDTSLAISSISSLPSASRILKKIPSTRSNNSPLRSKATIVFSNVGASGLFTIASISASF